MLSNTASPFIVLGMFNGKLVIENTEYSCITIRTSSAIMISLPKLIDKARLDQVKGKIGKGRIDGYGNQYDRMGYFILRKCRRNVRGQSLDA